MNEQTKDSKKLSSGLAVFVLIGSVRRHRDSMYYL